jgi:ATP-dependent helicase HrpB
VSQRKPALPVDAILPAIADSLTLHSNLVIEAPPGAGKTTRVPPALLGLVRGEVIVLEPRRIAARLAARRVAWELGEEAGETVGYQVRFEDVSGPRTRLRFVTEGILTRRLLSDPDLTGVAAVVLDEFHERHLEGDLSLALLRRLQKKRTDLRIVVMSATLESGPVGHFLGNCPVIRSEGRQFELSISHLPYSPDPLESQVKDAVRMLIDAQPSGNVLVFLPGVAEIHRAMRKCEALARQAGWLMLPLHGSLSPDEQDLAVAPSSSRKLILATNVAESSVTVDGVNAVIDSGLARIATYSQWSGLPTLHVGRISKASAKQRAGRAGRTGPGRVLRLYSEQDYLQRPEHDQPEIVRTDLSQLCLALRAMGIERVDELEWLDMPPSVAVEKAESLLEKLGATGNMVRRMARYPLSPRLSRILVEALERGVGEDGCAAAAVLGADFPVGNNDLLGAMDHAREDRRLLRHIEQLRKIARPPKQTHHDEDALLMSVLTGFPDRVARLRSENQVLLSAGGSAEIAGERPRHEFMVAVEAEDRKEKPLPLIRMTSRIEPEWLIDMFSDRVQEQSGVEWNRKNEQVETVSALLYDDLVIQVSRSGTPDEKTAELLAQKVLEAGIGRFTDADALEGFMARVEFAGLEVPDIPKALRGLCAGLKSFAEVKSAAKDLVSVLENQVGSRRLNELAPTRIRLKSGHQVPVHYGNHKSPWIASRLQDFFGMNETPRIGPQRTPIVVHLLAPNRRPVQTTTDLAGFWERLYPTVRRELMRRYPKHKWPEKP